MRIGGLRTCDSEEGSLESPPIPFTGSARSAGRRCGYWRAYLTG